MVVFKLEKVTVPLFPYFTGDEVYHVFDIPLACNGIAFAKGEKQQHYDCHVATVIVL
jgi:hypothetical protein